MAGTESFDTITLALAVLSADATMQTFGIAEYAVDAAQGVGWPYIVGHQQVANDAEFIGGIRVWTDLLLTFQVVGPDSIFTSKVRPAAQRMDALLQGLIQGNGNVNILGKMHRMEALYFSEGPIDGQMIRHLGGIYATQAL